MAHSQSARPVAKTTDSTAAQSSTALHQFDIAQACSKGELNISVSELLGCDYIFIQHPAKTLLMHERHIANTLNQLIELLTLTPKQKIFIGLHEDAQNTLRFYRFSCEWRDYRATNVSRTLITDNDQNEFMQMIFDCSSPFTFGEPVTLA